MGRKRQDLEEETTAAGSEQDAAAPDGEAPEAGDADGRVAQLEAELATVKDRYLRSLAEMENARRRVEREKEDAIRFANETLISGLLPILDNFIRALEAADQTTNFDALKSGVEATRRQLTEALTRAGVERIEAVGQPFDPNLHEAIMQVEPREGQGPHEVVEELRAGYKLNDRVLRPTLVKVTSG